MALDRSFEPDPQMKGSYYRRLEDITRALDKFEVTALPVNSAAQFVVYYFGAEKLAKAIVGINDDKPAETAFSRHVSVDPPKTKDAARNMKLKISEDELDALFKPQRQPQAAVERHHDPQSPVARFRTEAGEPHPSARVAIDTDHGQVHRRH